MTRTEFTRPNLLGALEAESDREMLDQAFLETPDYRTLIETSDRIIVVGRRGTGKSALAIKLAQYFNKTPTPELIHISPLEHQVLGVRPVLPQFGDTFTKIRAAARLIWRYALIMESVNAFSVHYKFKKFDSHPILLTALSDWKEAGVDTMSRIRETLKRCIDTAKEPEECISDIPISLNLSQVEEQFVNACDFLGVGIVLLVDKLDEGYEPDKPGTAFIDGLIQAAIDLQTKSQFFHPIIFLRDNIFRSVQALDPDYSRNIEGHVLRLHWDEQTLFNFVAQRLRIARDIQHESANKIWNRCTGGDLKGFDGFNRCLRLTLYRPRDLLSLLNNSFYLAGKHGQAEIVLRHVRETAQEISNNRLDDLRKEYEEILPGLSEYIRVFRNGPPEHSIKTAIELLERTMTAGSSDPVIQQDFLIMRDAQSVLKSLFSIGFVGLQDSTSGNYVFSHDGREPSKEFNLEDYLLIHPCYWMALNCSEDSLSLEQAQDIYDEYDIEVSSETPQIRNARIRQLSQELDAIPLGKDGAEDFEKWCYQAIRICFAKGLRNIELKPNKSANYRRDVVATNLGEGDAWRRIYEDYLTRQVIFEVKNYQDIEASDYHQVVSYLTGEYGHLGFIITREESVNLFKDRDVEWVREIYSSHRKLVIKLTGKFLRDILEKLKKPQKHDAVNDSIHRLLDTYTRLYLAGQTKADEHKKRRKKRRKRKAS